jgi:pimeloyl-ACP methyl ester carboxylesterase
MESLAQRLEAAGYVVHNLSYPSRQADPDTLLDDVTTKIEMCCADAARLHFVGHSLGGILARAYIARSRPASLGRVVLLSPPNQGSEIVDTLAGSWLFQAVMGPTGGVLGTGPDSLPNRLPTPDYELGVIAATESINPFGSWLIPGDDDGMVSVCRMRIAGMTDFITVARTHAFVMRGPEVADLVIRFLRDGGFQPTAGATVETPACD